MTFPDALFPLEISFLFSLSNGVLIYFFSERFLGSKKNQDGIKTRRSLARSGKVTFGVVGSVIVFVLSFLLMILHFGIYSSLLVSMVVGLCAVYGLIKLLGDDFIKIQQ